ncbi:hypothetical protein llap_4220 [Limosa lapponica baueri]|uniref:Uncharacterized protein n=1 Tax=Limosa lapponica baueri TaxID=1758121 RepID=A0A2I0UHE0_LIMLA|nr:hypothetical protein llap_4220 [Limosa lapponica baueri]
MKVPRCLHGHGAVLLESCSFEEETAGAPGEELHHMYRCTQAVCVRAKKWKTEPELRLPSLQIFFVSWQREMQNKARKSPEVPAHLATGQPKGYGPLLTLQRNCLLLLVLPRMAVPTEEEAWELQQHKAMGCKQPCPAQLHY